MKSELKLQLPIFLIIGCLIWSMSAVPVSAGNNGDYPEIATVDTLLFEDFEGPEGPFANNPLDGWAVIDSGVPEWDETSWSRYYNSPYPQYWNGDLARVMFSGIGAIGDWLISPSFNCLSDSLIQFSYKQSHSNRSSSDNDTIFVYGSTNGGASWDHTIYMSTESRGALNHPDTVEATLSSWAMGYPDVRIAFYFKGDNVLTWYIDEPTVIGDVNDTLLYEDFNGAWGEFGNNPPAGWTIINEVVPDPPNDNDWGRWYYSTWPATVARAYDNQNDQTANEWLISPSLTFSEAAVCSLSFYNSYWDDSFDPTDSAFILGSTDGGQTWNHTVVTYGGADDRDIDRDDSWRGFDISSWAQNQSDVKFAFHYKKDDPSYLGWWFIDDLAITEAVIVSDNVAALSIDYPTEFMIIGTDYYPQVTLQSLSSDQQTVDLNVVVTDHDNSEIYNYTQEGITLDPMEIQQVELQEPIVATSEGNHLITATVINPGDQDPSDDATGLTVPAYMHNSIGGPDNFGYYFVDSYVPNGPIFNWIDISQTGTQIAPTSHYFMSDGIPLGFEFEFYGQPYTSIWVNSHGELHLGSRDTWLSTNDCPLPDPSTPHAPLLAVFWDLLYIHFEEGQGVYYQQFTDPENYFVVQWQAKIDGQRSDYIEFEAILHENGNIVYQYNHVNDLPDGRGQAATVGMEYDVLPSGITYLCDDDNPANRLDDNLAILWYRSETSVGDDNSIIPENFALYQNYPNPFNATTTISFALPERADVNIEIVDILGRHVATLVNGYMDAGYHNVVWDAARNSSGVYFYKINAGDYSEIKKMSLLK